MAAGPDGYVPRDAYRRVLRARDVIEAAYAEPLELDDLAEVSGFSRFHFLRTFRRAFGATPHAYLTEVRIRRAKRLLAASEPVTEVCFAVGYESLGSFSSLFRRAVGRSPQAYQREVRRAIQLPERLAWLYIPCCFLRYFGALPAQSSRSAASAAVIPTAQGGWP